MKSFMDISGKDLCRIKDKKVELSVFDLLIRSMDYTSSGSPKAKS